MQLRHWQASLGKWRRAAKGYLPALICVGSSGHPRPHFSANAEKDPALLAPKHQICRHSSPTLICVGRALLETALSRIGERDVVLSAFSSNAAALGFYEHMGFERTGVTFDEGSVEETELVFRHKGGA